MIRPIVVLSVLLLLHTSVPLFGQEDLRPLAAEEVAVLPQGTVDLKAGFDFAKSSTNPFYSRSGYTFRIPTLRLDLGLGGMAEVQLRGDAFIHFRESLKAPGDHEEEVGDLSLFTKIRLLEPAGRRPGFGTKIGVKLPNTSDETGLGSDETDFFALLLLEKRWSRAHLHAHAGLGILGDPAGPRGQNDALIYSLAIDLPIAKRWKWMAEATGLTGAGLNPISTVYTGFARKGETVRYDCGVYGGLTDPSPDAGITCGLSLRRQVFTE